MCEGSLHFAFTLKASQIHGLCLACSTPLILHLLFADDCWLFVRVVDKEIKECKETSNPGIATNDSGGCSCQILGTSNGVKESLIEVKEFERENIVTRGTEDSPKEAGGVANSLANMERIVLSQSKRQAGRVRIFTWTVLCDPLPTKDRLLRRGVSFDLVGELFMMVLWSLWFSRNRLLSQGLHDSYEQVWDFAHRLLVEFKASKCVRLEVVNCGVRRPRRWLAPPLGTFKLNKNVARDFYGCLDLGFVIHNCHGEILMCGERRELMMCSSVMTEALPLRFDVSTPHNFGFHSLYIETDARVVVNEWGRDLPSSSELGLVFGDARCETSLMDVSSSCHVLREGNLVAYSLAKFAPTLTEESICIFPGKA
ncbi:hypothetical protein Ancab_019724 [Ancistrocladus abbreviatus]